MGLSLSTNNRTNDSDVKSFIKELNDSTNITRQRQYSFRNRHNKIDSNLLKSKLDAILVLEENYNNLFSKRSKSSCFEKIYSEYDDFSESIQNFFGSLSSEIGVDLSNFIADFHELLHCRMLIVESLQTLSSLENIQVGKILQIYSNLETTIRQDNKMKFISILSKSVISDLNILRNLIYALVHILTLKPLDAVLALDVVNANLENQKMKSFDDSTLSYYSRRLFLINSSHTNQSQLRMFFTEFKDLMLFKFGLYFDELAKQLQNETKIMCSSFILKIVSFVRKLKIESVYLVADGGQIEGFKQSPFFGNGNDRLHVLFYYKNEKRVYGEVNMELVEKTLRSDFKRGSLCKVKDEENDEVVYVINCVEENIYYVCQMRKSKLYNKGKYEYVVKSILEVVRTINLTAFFNRNF